MKTISLIGCMIIFSSCIQHSSEQVGDVLTVDSIEVIHAKGFDVEYQKGYVKIITQSFDNNAPFRDSIYLITDTTVFLDENLKTLSNIPAKLACQSSTYLAFLDELQSLDQVVGLCGIQYVQSESVSSLLEKNQVKELCMGERMEGEALYAADPDLLLIFPFQQENQQGENMYPGIPTLLVGEYLEKSQIARLEWIKLFGVLTGKVKEAEIYFEDTKKEYLKMKNLSKDQKKTFIMNLPFQDSWFMPSSNSVGVRMITDAGLNYFYSEEIGTENQLHSSEEVWQDGIEADYWIIIASRPDNYSLRDLLEEQPVYSEFKSVQENQVLFCNTGTTDYFAKGVIEPHVLLMDLMHLTGQLDNHTPKYFSLLE